MEYIFFYLLQILDSLNIIAVTLFIILLILFFVILYFGLDNKSMFRNDNKDYYQEELLVFNKLKKVITILLVVFSILFFIPSKQTLVLFGATYISKKTVNTIVTSEKLQKIDTIINLELDKRIKELKAEEIK